jgi:membrane protease YdiL (CAAX protease family)
MSEPNDDSIQPPPDRFPEMGTQPDLPPDLPVLDAMPVSEPPRQSHLWFWVALGAFGSLWIGLLVIAGVLHEFLITGVEFLPFIAVAVLAYLGERYIWARILAALALGLLGLLFFVGVAILTLVAVLPPDLVAGKPLGKMISPEHTRQLLTVLGLVPLVLLASLLCYLPAVRRGLARVLPIDPNSFVHATALVVVVGFTLASLVPLVVMGEPVVLLLLRQHKGHKLAEELSPATLYRSEIFTLMWQVPGAFLAVGYPWLRNLRQAAERVGLVRPRLRQVVFACVAAVVMVLAFHGIDLGVSRLWQWLNWPTTDSQFFFEVLLKAFVNPLGAVVIGVVAGLGEELVVRGLLQPRLGILLSNLFFTSLHAFQYNFDGLLAVFLIGLVLGLIRKYSNTTTSAIVHGLYDCLLILLIWAEVPGFR